MTGSGSESAAVILGLVADSITDTHLAFNTGQHLTTTSNVAFNSATLSNTGLHLLDTNASHDLIIAPGSDLSADRTLTITTGDANRTLTLSADATISGTNTGDQNIFQTIAVSGQSNVVADSTSDTLTFIGGSNITITTNATNDEITITAAGSSGDISAVGDCTTGDCFTGSSGTTLTFNDPDGDQTFSYDTTNNEFSLSDDLNIGANTLIGTGAIDLNGFDVASTGATSILTLVNDVTALSVSANPFSTAVNNVATFALTPASPTNGTDLSANVINASLFSTLSLIGTGSATVSGNIINASRTIQAGSSDTVTVSGAVGNFADSCTSGSGTCTSTANVVAISQTYTGNTGAALNITSATTNNGLVFRANDDGTFTDSTAFVIDQSGNVGIGGDTTPSAMLTVGADVFQVTSTGTISSATLVSGGTQCLQADSSGVISGTGSACGAGSGFSGLTLAASSGVSQTISDGNTITIAAGAGITTTAGATDTVTIAATLGTSVDLTSEVTGILPLANGGTNKNMTAVNGGIVYSDADSLEVTSAGVSGQALVSGGAGAPTWFAPTAGSLLFAGTSGVLSQDNTNLFWDDSNNRFGLGTNSSLKSTLHVTGSTTASGADAIAGIYTDTTLTNSTSSGFQFGNRFLNTVNGTVAGTEVGTFIRMTDNTSLANTVRGLEVQAYSGTNVNGVNTGIASYGKTFGIHAVTDALAGGISLPAAVFADLDNGTAATSGNAIRAYTDNATSADLVSIYQETSAYTGNALIMDLGNNGGSFASGNFISLKNAGTEKFHVTSTGATYVSLPGTQTTVALCHATNGQSNNDQIVDCSGAPSDYAEWYAAKPEVQAGEVVSLTGENFVYDSAGSDPVTGQVVSLGEQKIAVLGKTLKNDQPFGIVSTAPYQVIGEDLQKTINENPNAGVKAVPIALNGRVPVKVSEENGPIKAGDRLTVSEVLPGHAAKQIESGMTIGVALEDSNALVDQILVFVNFTYNKVDVAFDSESETIVLEKNLDMNGLAITNVKSIASISGKWSIDENGLLVVEEIQTKRLQVENGITTFDRSTGEPYCIFIENGAMQSLLGKCEDAGQVSGATNNPDMSTLNDQPNNTESSEGIQQPIDAPATDPLTNMVNTESEGSAQNSQSNESISDPSADIISDASPQDAVENLVPESEE